MTVMFLNYGFTTGWIDLYNGGLLFADISPNSRTLLFLILSLQQNIFLLLKELVQVRVGLARTI